VVRSRSLAPLRRTPPASGTARRLRLDFDGGPWLLGYPLSHTSPWAELVCGAIGGLTLGLLGPGGVFAVTGWVLGTVLAADILQAVLPLTFRQRMIAALVGGPVIAWLALRAVAAVPWSALAEVAHG
jgi:hypothetical protein